MYKVGDAVNEISNYLKASNGNVDEMLKDALQDETVKEFIDMNDIDDDTINRFRSTLIIFYKRKQNGEQLKLIYHNAYKHAIIDVREVVERRKPKKTLTTDTITSQLRGLSFSDLIVDGNNEKLVEAFKRLVGGYNELKTSKGIWVHGEFGRGKTYILGALANELHKEGANVTFISPKTFIDNYMTLPFSEKESYLKQVAETEVLILDDMGTEYLSEYGVKAMYELMAIRYAQSRLTFASSNLTISEYIQLLSKANRMDAERLQERLRHLFTQLKLNGDNRRG